MYKQGEKVKLLLFTALISQILLDNVDCQRVFDVLNYGAIGNGQADDSWAFSNAWKDICSSNGESTLLIPGGKTYLVHPITFSGPCNPGKISINLAGNVIAPNSPSAWKTLDQSKWITFKYVNGLNIFGGGTVNGCGKQWWDISCRLNPRMPGCNRLAPTGISFLSCNDVTMNSIRFRDSPQTHIHVMGSTNIQFSSLDIQAPGNSPNTDGVHIQASQRVSISDSLIGTGDDCVSIGDHCSNINVTYLTCGPGHGVSIGSLGKGGNAVDVHDIRVHRVNFTGTTNGARIKTWSVGRGTVKNVEFAFLNFINVSNPIIIDQYYCSAKGACGNTTAGIQISDVRYYKVLGTSNTEVAVNLGCNLNVPCTGIVLDNVNIKSSKQGKNAVSECVNAHGKTIGAVNPASCLKS